MSCPGGSRPQSATPRNTLTTFDGYRKRRDARRKQLEWDAAEARSRGVADSLATAQ